MKVIIRRRQPSENLPKQVREEAIKNLASIYVGRLPLDPLSKEETERFMPALVGLPASHNEFPKACQRFWAEMTIKVPFAGRELETAVSADGDPINMEDYLMFRFALAHPHCGKNEATMRKNPIMTHYIFNPQEEELANNKKIEHAKLADKAYLKDSEDKEKMIQIIQVLSPKTTPNLLSEMQLQNVLYNLKSESPESYYIASTDKNLMLKAEIYNLVNSNILSQVGNKFIYESEPIGSSVNEAIAYFKDARNSKVVLEIRSRLKELV
jgi:hypothetical protein